MNAGGCNAQNVVNQRLSFGGQEETARAAAGPVATPHQLDVASAPRPPPIAPTPLHHDAVASVPHLRDADGSVVPAVTLGRLRAAATLSAVAPWELAAALTGPAGL